MREMQTAFNPCVGERFVKMDYCQNDLHNDSWVAGYSCDLVKASRDSGLGFFKQGDALKKKNTKRVFKE